MESEDDQWQKRPTRMHVEYVDGGESSIGSSLHSSSDTNSSSDDGSPNSLPEVCAPQIPPYGLIDQTKTMLPPSISSFSISSITSSGELFQIITPDVIETTGTKEETSPEVAPITTTTEEEEVVSDNNVGVVLGALESPPVQVMDRSSEADHDPYRIPTDVFEDSTSVAAVDWSNASNDSLFSIRIGNGSFATDYRSKAWARDSVRPKRDLTLTPERWSKLPSPKSPTSPREEEEVAVDDKALKSPEERKKTEGDSSTVVEKEIKDHPIEEPKATHAESLNLRDNKDETGDYPKNYSCTAEKNKNSGRKSSRSWCLRIFPCLAWPSWCFNTCCRPLCCSCKWPSCKCRFPSCSCCTCSLAICFCEHPCYSSMYRSCSSIGLAICYICRCKPLTVLCCVTGPNSKDQVTDKQDYKGGCCSCFSGGTSCCSCRSCFSCRSCCSFKSCGSCFPCGSCCKSCSSFFSCGSCCKSCSSCFSCESCCKSCSSCFSCGSCCKSCSSCFSCGSCCSCKSCSPCFSCGSCWKSCGSCFSCGLCYKSCRSYFSCGSCSCSCFTCKCNFYCCSNSWWRCRPKSC